MPQDILQRSARNFYGLMRGNRLDLHGTWTELLASNAVCVGEQHDDPEHHYVQWRLLASLSSDARARGLPFAAGFEAFQTPFQPHLTAYQQGRGTQATLLKATQYAKRWGYPFAYYRPLLQSVAREGGDLLALNAPQELTRAAARFGLEKLTASQRQQLPELVLTDPEHRKFFIAAMSGHRHGSKHDASGKERTATERPHDVRSANVRSASDEPHSTAQLKGHPTAHTQAHTRVATPDSIAADRSPTMSPALERFYGAQVIWDETMAATAARWLENNPGGRIVVIAGNGHCHNSAIPRRFTRRTGVPMLSVRPVQVGALAQSLAPRDAQFELLLVIENRPPSWPPPPVGQP